MDVTPPESQNQPNNFNNEPPLGPEQFQPPVAPQPQPLQSMPAMPPANDMNVPPTPQFQAAPMVAPQPQPAFPGAPIAPVAPAGLPATDENPEKHYLIALLLSYLFGSLGIDRFYLGKVGTGVLKLLTFGGLGIWHIVDLLLIGFGKVRAKGDDRHLEGFAKNSSWVKMVSIVLVIVNTVVIVGILAVAVLGAVANVQNRDATTSQTFTTQTYNTN